MTIRKELLSSLGVSLSVVEELLSYNRNHFKHPSSITSRYGLPLNDELFVEAWKNYIQESKEGSVFEVLRQKLIQFQFPIQKGISDSIPYQKAIKTGILPSNLANPLQLRDPQLLQLELYPSLAGHIPLISTPNKDDFFRMVQALALKNEPHPFPNSIGAVMITGYNNWDRLRTAKASSPDRFILLTQGNYSGVSAAEIEMNDKDWKTASRIIRLEHECTHYLTKRLLTSMQNNPFDELIADFMGITSYAQRYHSKWFLRFMGLEAYPQVRANGRLHFYRGNLSEPAFESLCFVLTQASASLEDIANPLLSTSENFRLTQVQIMIALTLLTLEEIAFDEQRSFFCAAFKKAKQRVTFL
ncbi:hypothetical protein WDW89_19905 [Deltaproteobacteria bacterium TL4]